MEIMEAYELVKAELANSGAILAHNRVMIGICRNKATGEVFTNVMQRSTYCFVEVVHRHNGTQKNSSIRITIGKDYEDKFSCKLTEKTIKAKVAKAVDCWNALVEKRNLVHGPFFYKKDLTWGKLNDWFEIVGSYTSEFECRISDHMGDTWKNVTIPLIERIYKETGFIEKRYESYIMQLKKEA